MPRLRQLVGYFLYLGSLGFGGPVALVGYMQRDLVDRRAWFTKEQYMKGLALAQLAPGPLAAQLAMCLGYTHSGVRGATLVGLAFILPSYVLTVALAVLYVRLGGLGWMQAAFYGVGAAVVGIIVAAGYRLARLTNERDALLWGIAVLVAAVTALAESEIALLFIAAGAVALLVRAPPRWLGGRSTLASLAPVLPILWLFAKAGAFVFGSGLAIVPFLHESVVAERGWITERQFLDAVAVAMLTPGPVVITVAFIGYLVAGHGGALAAAVGVFLPVYLFVVIPFRWFDRWSDQPQIKAFVRGVTAAAAGAIAGACVVLARRAIVDPATALLAILALVAVARFRLPEPLLIGAAAAAGLALFPGAP